MLPGNPTSRSSTSRPPCASARVTAWESLASLWAQRISSNANSMMRQRCCSRRCKRLRVLQCPTGLSPLAMRIWADSTKRERSSSGYARSPLSWCRASFLSETPSTASCICRVCVWRWARRHEADRLSALLCRHHDPGMAAFFEPAGTLLLGFGPPAGVARDLCHRGLFRPRGVDHPALRDLHPLRGLHRPRADRDDPVVQRDADLAVDGLRPRDGEHANPDGEPAAALVFVDRETARRGRPLGSAGLCVSGDRVALGYRPAVVRLHHGAACAGPCGADDGGARAAAVLGGPAAGGVCA